MFDSLLDDVFAHRDQHRNEQAIEIVLERLRLMDESASLVLERTASLRSAEEFVATSNGVTLMDAVALRLQTIGENAKKIERVAPSFFALYVSINWNVIMRFRDLIAHHYERTNYEVLFDICTVHIPPLKQVLETMIHDLQRYQQHHS